MKKILTLAFLLLSVFAFSQRQTTRYLTLNCNIQQVGSSSGKPHISCNCNDQGGTWDSGDVQVGDTLFFNDAGVGYKLPIDSIVTPGVPTVVVRADWTGLGLVIIPTGRGSISRSAANGLDGTVAGMTAGDNQYLEEDFVSNINAVGGSNLASNGVSLDGDTIQMGGELNQNTEIDLHGKTLVFDGENISGSEVQVKNGAYLSLELLKLQRTNNSTGTIVTNVTINPTILTLPAGVNNQVRIINNQCGSSFAIDPNSTETIAGASTLTLQDGEALAMIYNSATTDWVVWARNTASTVSNGDKGDVDVTGSGIIWTIDTAAITTIKIAANAVDSTKIATGGIGNTDIADGVITASKIATGAVGPTQLASTAVTPGSYTNTNLTVDADGRITAASNGSGGVGVTDGDKGDIDVTSSGTIWTIDTSAVTSLKILDSTIITADIADNAITGAKIAASTIDSTDIATGGIGNTDLAAGIVTTSKIAASAVDSTKIAPNSVGASELISTAVTPGSYTNTNLTVDADGRITAASNGTGSSPAGSNTEIQFNASGAFGASSLLTYSTADSSMSVNGIKIWKGRWGKSANTAVGESTLTGVTTGTGNTAIGSNALRYNTTGSNNVANGYQALASNTTGGSNTANGFQALYSNTTGGSNTANGRSALFSNTTGNSNTANGFQALASNTTGYYNTAHGYQALYSNTTGGTNTADGAGALYSNKANSRSTAIGYNAMLYADNRTSGRETYNTALGYEALRGSTTAINNTGRYNTAIGDQALYSNTSGDNNTANGVWALLNNTTGSNNIAIGGNSGRYIADGSTANAITNNSVYLGSNTKALANNQTNQIVIGHNATGLGDSTAVLGAAMKKVRLGDNLTFKTDQVIGAGQDNYVLTYDHSAGTVSLEATGGVAEDSLVVGHVPYVSAANTIQTDPAGDADALAYDDFLNILTVKRIKLKGSAGTSTQLLGRNTTDYNVSGITVGDNLTLSSNVLSAKDTVFINLIAAKPGVAVTQTAGYDYYDATFLVPEYLNGFDLARVDYAMTNSTATTGSWTVGIRLMSTTNTSVTSNGCAATFNAGYVRASSSGGLSVSKNQWLYVETHTSVAGTLDGTNEGLLATLMFVK